MSLFKKCKILIEYNIFLLLEKFLSRKNIQFSKSILFINNGRIGDLIVSSIILENTDLLNEYEQIIFIIKQEYLILFSEYNGPVKFIGYNPVKYKFSLFYKIKFLNSIRSMEFEKCINLTAARGIINDEITLLSGAKEKFCNNNNLKYLGSYFGNKLDKRYWKILFSEIINEYDKHIKLLQMLSNSNNAKVNFYNRLTFRTKINSEFPLNSYEHLIVIAPISSNKNRDWPYDYFKQLIKLLGNNYHIILLGTRNQKRLLQKIGNDTLNVTILAGVLQINEISALLKKSNLFIGLDSGLTHLALKLGIPLIAIIGGGFYQRFFPYMESKKVKYLYNKMDCFGCEWNCIYDKKHCIEDVTVDKVFDEMGKTLHIKS